MTNDYFKKIQTGKKNALYLTAFDGVMTNKRYAMGVTETIVYGAEVFTNIEDDGTILGTFIGTNGQRGIHA